MRILGPLALLSSLYSSAAQQRSIRDTRNPLSSQVVDFMQTTQDQLGIAEVSVEKRLLMKHRDSALPLQSYLSTYVQEEIPEGIREEMSHIDKDVSRNRFKLRILNVNGKDNGLDIQAQNIQLDGVQGVVIDGRDLASKGQLAEVFLHELYHARIQAKKIPCELNLGFGPGDKTAGDVLSQFHGCIELVPNFITHGLFFRKMCQVVTPSRFAKLIDFSPMDVARGSKSTVLTIPLISNVFNALLETDALRFAGSPKRARDYEAKLKKKLSRLLGKKHANEVIKEGKKVVGEVTRYSMDTPPTKQQFAELQCHILNTWFKLYAQIKGLSIDPKKPLFSSPHLGSGDTGIEAFARVDSSVIRGTIRQEL